MLVYTATKQSFLSDVRDNAIHEKIRLEVKRRTGSGASESHIAAWRNSMQFMASILQDEGLPQDAGVSIEYQLPLSSKRIDFILTGQDEARQETAVIIELKQWSQVDVTDMDAVVRTRLGGGEVNTQHPSYQAWSYAAMIEDYNETVRKEHIVLKPCAYLHNLDVGSAINDARYLEHTECAPVLISGDARRPEAFNCVKLADR